MKKYIILIALAISSNIAIYAQSFTGMFDSIFRNISRSGATTGILYERVIPFAQLQNFNSIASVSIDTSNREHFLQSYSELYNAAFQQSGNLSFDRNSLESLINSNDPIVDIGILHYRFNAMDSAVGYQKLYFDSDSILRENLSIAASLYAERIAFVASPLKESVNMGSVTFRFNNLFRFDNTDNPIVGLMVDFDDGNGMRSITNNLITVTYTSTSGIKTLHFEALLSNGDILTAYATLYCIFPPPMNAPNTSEWEWRDEFEDAKAIWAKITPPNPYDGGNFSKARGNVWIYYANANKKLRKPVLIVDGFDPTNDRTFEWHRNADKGGKSIWKMLENGCPNIGRQLLDKGYDLVVLDLPEGGIYIEQNAMVCIEVINRINQMLAESGSEEEIVVVGPSMGGQITRYALSYMEKNPNANTNYGNHNCRLWVSFDSPHQGANISMGAQALIYYFGKEGDIGSIEKIWDNTLNCNAAQQMLKHHRSPWAASKHNMYYQRLGSLGHPNNLRKIAISNGSLNNTANGVAYQIAFEGVLWWSFFLAGTTVDIRLRNAVHYGEGEVFRATYWVLFIPISKEYIFNNTTGKCSPDVAPGGYYNTYDQIQEAIGKVGATVQTNQGTHCFMPITSVLDINGNMDHCTNISNRDLVAEGRTPFNAYWGPTYKNMDHISFDNSLSTWVLREIETYTQGSKTIELCEYQNYTVHLPSDVSSSTEVFWTCSNNLIIVSGQGTKTITVKALATGDTWVQATVGSLTHSNLRTDAPNLAQSKKQLKKHYITVISSSPYASAPTNITQNTTWHTPYQINQPLTIENGATLTIQNTVHCGPLAKIIVERGGRLIVDGGVLTNACDDEIWRGIEVWGTPNIRQQYTQNHGIVQLKNGARIENSDYGIFVGRKWYLGYGGGIVYADHAHFINTKQAIYFDPYIGELDVYGRLVNNKSYFKNCEFILDDNALFDDPGIAQVELQGVKGVFFQNSVFTDGRDIFSKSKLTNGIYANNASMRVGSAYWSFSSSLFDGSFGYDGCEFSGFDRAIYIQSSSTRQSQIYFSKFSGNGIGIDCYASNGLLVEGCEFHIPNYIYDKTNRLHGIWIEESSGFSIVNNYFTGGSGTGIYFKKNGFGNHFVKSNTFNHLCVACSAEGVNADIPQYESQGLVFQCNSFSNNNIDIKIYEESRIRRFQSGENNRAAGNTFSNSNYNIYNSSKFELGYYYFDPDGAHHISHLHTDYPIVDLSPKDYVSCLSYGYGGSNYYHVAVAQDDINKLNDLYASATMAYQNGTNILVDDEGSSGNTIDWGSPDVKEILESLRDYDFDQYMSITEEGEIEIMDVEINFPASDVLVQQVFLSVYLTNFREIMDKICYKALALLSSPIEDEANLEDNYNVEQYRTWVSRLNTIESKYLLAESYIETGEFEMKDAKMEEIYTSFISEDGDYLCEETDIELFEDYERYFQLSQEYREYIISHGDEAEIPPHILEELMDLSAHNNIAGIKSTSLLEMISTEAVEYRIPDLRDYQIHPACLAMIVGLHKNASEDNPIYEEVEDLMNKDNIEINVYPNPANNTVFISLDKMPETSVYYQLYDIQGKELQNGNFSNQQQELDISSLSKGIYFISVSVENQSRITRKVVKE